MRTRFLGIALFLIIFIFLSTACAPTNKVAGLSNNNEQTDMSSSAGNKTAQNVGFNDNKSIQTVSFIDLKSGWIAIGQSIYRTEDGGQHWSKIADINAGINDIDFLSLKLGWLATSDGLFKTEDGGSTWRNIVKPQLKAATRVQFVDEKNGWIDVYHDRLDIEVENPDYYYLRTTDGGENWTNINIPDPNQFTRLAYFFISQNQGWLISGSQPGAGSQPKRLYKTMDGGRSWNEISSTSIPPREDDGLPIGGYVSDLFFLNENYGWLTESRGQIFVTTDGGKDWTLVDKHPVREWFMAKPFFVNIKEGYVLNSESGTSLLVTKDGGLNWKPVINGKIEPLMLDGKVLEPLDSKLLTGDHHFENANYVYLDGYWHDTNTGQFGTRYVISFRELGTNGVATNPNQPIIEVYNEGRTPDEEGIEWVKYSIPKEVDNITYMDIENDQTLVHFVSSKGIKGTLNLKTHEWVLTQ